MNKCIVTGRICNDIEVKNINGTNNKVISNTIAVRREFKNKNTNEYDSDFIKIIVWQHNADFMSKYVSKGDLVGVVGRWQHRKYDSSEGTKYIDELVVENIEILSKPNKANNQPSNQSYQKQGYESKKRNDWYDDYEVENDLPF